MNYRTSNRVFMIALVVTRITMNMNWLEKTIKIKSNLRDKNYMTTEIMVSLKFKNNLQVVLELLLLLRILLLIDHLILAIKSRRQRSMIRLLSWTRIILKLKRLSICRRMTKLSIINFRKKWTQIRMINNKT